MLGLIFNDDGSIFAAALPKYVTQGSSGELDSLKICVAFKDTDITDEGTTVICRFRLPDGTKNDITLFNNGTFEFQNTPFKCKYGYLTADQTLYEGILLVSIEVLSDVGSNILYTYNARITVNPTTYDPTSDYVLINNAQYENLATQIENLQYRGASKQYVNEIVTHAVFEDVSVVFDDVPTQNSNNAVKSGGVWTYVASAVDNLEYGLTSGDVIPAKSLDVTSTINGHDILDIFESNGTTVKNATDAVNATNAEKTQITNGSTVHVNIVSTSTDTGMVPGKTYQCVYYDTYNYYNFGLFLYVNDSGRVFSQLAVGTEGRQYFFYMDGTTGYISIMKVGEGTPMSGGSFYYKEIK